MYHLTYLVQGQKLPTTIDLAETVVNNTILDCLLKIKARMVYEVAEGTVTSSVFGVYLLIKNEIQVYEE